MDKYEENIRFEDMEREQHDPNNPGNVASSRKLENEYDEFDYRDPQYRRSDSGERNKPQRQEWRRNPEARPEWGYGRNDQQAKPVDNLRYRDQPYTGPGMAHDRREDPNYQNPAHDPRAGSGRYRYRDMYTTGELHTLPARRAREAYRETWREQGPYEPAVDNRRLGRRDPGFYREESHRGKGPKNYTHRDPRIYEYVNDALTDSHTVDATDIEVYVHDGNVILSGTVDTRSSKREAEYAIEDLPGVRNVENRLHTQTGVRRSMSMENAAESPAENPEKEQGQKAKTKAKSKAKTKSKKTTKAKE